MLPMVSKTATNSTTPSWVLLLDPVLDPALVPVQDPQYRPFLVVPQVPPVFHLSLEPGCSLSLVLLVLLVVLLVARLRRCRRRRRGKSGAPGCCSWQSCPMSGGS